METGEREKKIYKVTLQGSVVNVFLMLFKFFAGIFANSAAMIADAVHSLTDFITDFIVLIFVRVSSKPRDEGHDYGHGKYETLATVIIALFLFFVGVGIFWDGAYAIYRVVYLKETLESPGILALIAAIVSVVSKELLFRYTIKVGEKLNSQAVVSNAWHHRSDALSSIGTTIGIGGAVLLGAKWSILDPIAAVLVSFLILKEAISMLKTSVGELLEGSLSAEVEIEIVDVVKSVEGVGDISNLKTRRIGNYYAIELYLHLDGQLPLHEATDIANRVKAKLIHKYGGKTQVGIYLTSVEV